MTVRCQYCGHAGGPGAGACANCGAPLPAAEMPAVHGRAAGDEHGPARHGMLGAYQAEVAGWAAGLGGPHSPARHGAADGHRPGPHAEHSGHQHPEHHHAGHHPARGALGFVRRHLAGEAEAVVHRHHPKWQWRAAAGAAVAVLLLLAFLMVKSCALTTPALTGPPGFAPAGPGAVDSDPLAALPAPLRAATCRPHAETEGVRSCVLAAGSPLLMGEITGGRALAFQVHTSTPAALRQAIAQWRTAGASVVADGDVFAAVSAAAAVWFADTNSGLRVDTGSFANAAGARTFLTRSGLLQP
ncbi:hypothetical protein [Nocardia sp. NPDC024068]|uniref:hypothetical protein n=1 Tax=Nocardia sp. NPDC024068 TaxID=3157197 RepID=UPI00340DA2ED